MNKLVRQILMARIYDVAERTELDAMPRLGKHLHTNVWLKREDKQPVFSFKIRGAYNCIFHLSDEEKKRGVLCASAGNHAQGVALSGQYLNISTTIVMPITAPELKIQACKERGATVILHGESFDDAYAHALALCEEQGKTFIHPFDDLTVIAGQGTIGKEMIEQQPDLDAIFVPIGGGGLISGVAAYIKFIAPKCKIIGVEPVESASMNESIIKKKRVKLSQVGSFADGTAVKEVGVQTFKLCREYVDDIICVTTEEICAAMKDIFDDTRAISEPSGALSVAGIKKYIHQNPEHGFKNIGGILSGANINFERLQYVAELTELGQGREALLAVTIPEKIGSFLNFIHLIGKRNITEFNYRYADEKSAVMFVGIQTNQGQKDKEEIINALTIDDFSVIDLSDNEMAKLHVRHMVGGKSESINNERLLRFIFPERPNALFQFLTTMHSQWNISLFHYRNHGSDYARVLVGMQVPDEDNAAFEAFLEQLGYEHIDETDNPAFHLFL